ncbi:hypothetical protein N9189_02555 [Pirellulaceae bacterium]|nr:hypothetical protein [Pirellulaceae bacterium]
MVASGAGGTIFSSIAAGAGVASQPAQPVDDAPHAEPLSQQLFFFENMRARRPGFLQGSQQVGAGVSQQVGAGVSQQVGAGVSQQVFAGAHAFLAAILQRSRLNN